MYIAYNLISCSLAIVACWACCSDTLKDAKDTQEVRIIAGRVIVGSKELIIFPRVIDLVKSGSVSESESGSFPRSSTFDLHSKYIDSSTRLDKY